MIRFVWQVNPCIRSVSFVLWLVAVGLSPVQAQVALQTLEPCVDNITGELQARQEQETFSRNVLELHTARTAMQFWGYELEPEFQQTFARGYQLLQIAFQQGALPSLSEIQAEENEEDIDLMLDAQEDQIEQFREFLAEAREQYASYGLFDLSAEQILEQQCQFSLIVWRLDREFWAEAALFWSIFVPLSEGP